jgi:hypothetical protein
MNNFWVLSWAHCISMSTHDHCYGHSWQCNGHPWQSQANTYVSAASALLCPSLPPDLPPCHTDWAGPEGQLGGRWVGVGRRGRGGWGGHQFLTCHQDPNARVTPAQADPIRCDTFISCSGSTVTDAQALHPPLTQGAQMYHSSVAALQAFQKCDSFAYLSFKKSA